MYPQIQQQGPWNLSKPCLACSFFCAWGSAERALGQGQLFAATCVHA